MNGPTRRATRRSFLAGAAATAGTLAVGTYLPRAYAAEPLRVSSYAGKFEEDLAQFIYPAFTKETGIAIESIGQPGGRDWFIQLAKDVAAGKVAIDVVMCGGQIPRLLPQLFQSLDESKMPNVENIRPYLFQRKPDGALDAVPGAAWYTTFVTNTDVYPKPPTSWADAWDPKFKGTLGWNVNIDVSYLPDIVAETFFGGQVILETRHGLREVLEKAAELKPNVKLWYGTGSVFEKALRAGEVNAGQFYQDSAHVMAEAGYPVRSTFPREGGVLDFGFWGLVEGSTRHEAAYSFINYCSDPTVQSEITRRAGTAPVVPRRLTNLSDTGYLAASSDNTPIVPRYEVYVKNGDWIAKTWAELMGDAA
jgi:putative spermidine/putrescine transport system substrate-binding protein